MAARGTRPRVIFRVAAGPRTGYGHLVRATVLARAMGVRATVSIRGGAQATQAAAGRGCRVVRGSASTVIRAARPDLLIIDDPSTIHASLWRRTAGRSGVPVASIHDIGLAYCGADLTIDGSVTRRGRRPRGPALLGPRYAILAPARRGARAAGRLSVLIALGGGPRRGAALTMALAIRRLSPNAEIRIAGGFGGRAPDALPPGVTWLGPRQRLSEELARAAVVVVGGGVSLYEACCVGVPAVAVGVVPAQRPTIREVVARGAALDGGRASTAARSASQVARLLADGQLRSRLSAAGRRLVDGNGARRVARALGNLAAGCALGVR